MNKYNILSVIVFLSFVSCNSTKMVSSWTQPGKTVHMEKLQKVLVVAMLLNETSRHKAEDQMVTYLNGTGIASYSYLNANFNTNSDKAIQRKIKSDGFDGAITMRLVDLDKDSIYYPGSTNVSYPDYYRNFDGYYYRNYELYSTPGIYSQTKVYTIETTVYSMKEDKLIWSGVTKSVNPAGVNRMTNEISTIVYKKMRKEGFVSNK